MRWRVLISARSLIPFLDDYRQFFEENEIELVVPPVGERLSEHELLSLVGNVDGVICGDDRFTARVFECAPRLKVIAKWGTGIDSIDVEAARRHGVRVRNTPNAFTEPVADTVLGYVLAFARQLPWMDRDIRGGTWEKRPGVSLRESVLGIVGLGHIGQAVAARAHAFGMQVLGNDIVTFEPSVVERMKVEIVPLDDLLRRADFVSLNCSLNSTSFHLIGARELALMKPTACVINTSRGPVIDEAALVAALREKRIGGAALDVFEDEPLPQSSGLRQIDNCLLAPHNANNSPAAWRRVHTSTIDALLEELRRPN